MEHFFYSFWWLVFPLAFFIAGAWNSWLRYRRHKDRLDLLKSYVSQGKDPPPELIRALESYEAADDADEDDQMYSAYGAYDRRGRHLRRAYRHAWRTSPYWSWRTAIVTGAVSLGFFLAAEYSGMGSVEGPFRLVAIILACVSAGHAVSALVMTSFRRK